MGGLHTHGYAQMSSGTQIFSFKTAILKPTQSYFVTKNQIELANKDGSDTIVRFESITSLLYADTTAREYKFRRLDIGYSDEKQMRIGLTSTASSKVLNDNDLSEFYKLIHEFSSQIDTVRPDLSVTIGETSRINWLYFAVGALIILGAVGILLGAYLSGVSDKKLQDALLPIVIMAGFGAYICFMARPWVRRPDIDLSKFKRVLEKLLEG